MNIHYINNQIISISTIKEIIKKTYKLELSEDAKEKINSCRSYLDTKIRHSEKPIYGITTGFGSLCNTSIPESDLEQLQENLVKSHACGMGDEVDSRIVKIMMFLKIQGLSYGNSGVCVETVQQLITFFNLDIIPVVYQLGSLGASGDLAPLAHIVLPMIGMGEVYFENKKQNAVDVLNKLNIKPIKLKSKEGLALLNGTQFMQSHAVEALIRVDSLLKFADISAALSLDSYFGLISPFNHLLHEIRPHDGQIQTSANICKLLEGSQIMAKEKTYVQDPYSFRCVPQVHGAVKDTFNYVKSVIETEINSVTDNPTIFPQDDLILSGGNFHGEPLALAMDFLSIAISEISNISERRIYRLISGERGLPAFLVAKPGLNSGFMIAQYAAAAIVSQNKQLATPASVDSISSSNEQEDHVSMGGNAATKLLRIVANVERVIAIECFAASQALKFREPLKTSPLLQNFLTDFRNDIPCVENDIIMFEMMEKALQKIKKMNVSEILT
ncbi:MAG: histidine ammonia-lyase [Bacteroidales bacterium]|jgi:histidine ammonia-lyase|nr:histidine ammonia-lyase [Bacteroidales bacterium]